jgi:hypothetical protein
MYSVRPLASRSSPARLREPSGVKVGRDWRSKRNWIRSWGEESRRYRIRERRVRVRNMRRRRSQKRVWVKRVR